MSINPQSLAFAILAIPIQSTLFFTKSWVFLITLYLRWTQASLRWSTRTAKRIVRGSLKWQVSVLIRVLSVVVSSTLAVVKLEEQQDSLNSESRVHQNQSRKSNGTANSPRRPLVIDRNPDTGFGRNDPHVAKEFDQSLSDVDQELTAYNSDASLSLKAELLESSSGANEENITLSTVQGFPDDSLEQNPSSPTHASVEKQPDSEDGIVKETTPEGALCDQGPLETDAYSLGPCVVKVTTEVSNVETEALECGERTEDRYGLLEEDQEAVYAECDSSVIGNDAAPDLTSAEEICTLNDALTDARESGSPLHKSLGPELSTTSNDASGTVQQLLINLEEEMPRLSPIKEEPERWDGGAPSFTNEDVRSDTASNHDEESASDTSSTVSLHAVQSHEQGDIHFVVLSDPVGLPGDRDELRSATNGDEKETATLSPVLSPALSFHKVHPEPRSRKSSFYDGLVFPIDDNSAEFYKEAVDLTRELDMRIGLLVVSLMTERENASLNWTAMGHFGFADGPSNAALLKIAGLVENALGQKLYDTLGNESQKDESILQDAWQAWAVFCMKLAMEPLLFGLRLRSKSEIAAILKQLSTEAPEPYTLWRFIDNDSWCSPFTNQSLVDFIENISVLSRTDEDAEAYCLLEDVHQMLLERGVNSSQLRSGLHKFDRLSPSFSAVTEQTRDVLLFGLLEVLELAGESQIALAIDKASIREACGKVVDSAVALADLLRSRRIPEMELFIVNPGAVFNKNSMESEGGGNGLVSCTICPGLRDLESRRRILLKPVVVQA